MTTTTNFPTQAFRSADERSFAADFLAYYRRGGDRAAWKLAKRMADARQAGCSRDDCVAMLNIALAELPAALAALPTRH